MTRKCTLLGAIVGLAVLLTPAGAWADSTEAPKLPPIRHVWLIVLENTSYNPSAVNSTPSAFATPGATPYLQDVLKKQGNLLTQYWATGHNSMDNYAALVSGQSPTPGTQGDAGTGQSQWEWNPSDPQIDPHGQAVGQGALYPAKVKTLFDQMAARGLTWKAYQEDLGNEPAIYGADGYGPDGLLRCPHLDKNAKYRGMDQYLPKHDPVTMFHSLFDDQASCRAHDVSLYPLAEDLQSVKTTPNFSFVTPNMIHDWHDTTTGGTLASQTDTWLRQYVPMIMSSPAYRQDGMIVVTFDEAFTVLGVGGDEDTEACCGEIPGPNSPMPGESGPGGGRIGALAISPFIKPGTTVDPSDPLGTHTGAGFYNHYSFLRSMEDLFGVDKETGVGGDGDGHLGFAGTYDPDYPGPGSFGSDVYNGYGGTPAGAPASAPDGPVGPRKADGSGTWQHPSPQGNDLTAVSCPTTSACIAVGDQGAAVATRDGGDHWSAQDSATVADLKGVSCATADACVAVGDGGTVLSTADGGTRWSGRSSGDTQALNGVNCPTALVCVAVGDGGTILRSGNGGANWRREDSGTTLPLYGVSCPSPAACFAAGFGGTILRSDDGGIGWSSQVSGTTQRLHGISCGSPTTCFAAGDQGAGVRTTDGGNSWSPPPGQTPPLRTYLGASCGDAGTCFAVGWVQPGVNGGYLGPDGGGVVDVTRGGAPWAAQTSNTRNPLFGVSCPSATACFAVGARGTIVRTTDSGANPWTSKMGGRDSDPSRVVCWSHSFCGFEGISRLNAADCTDADTCVAVGGEQTIMATSDGGQTWATQKSGLPTPPARPQDAPPLSAGLNGVSCPASGRCIAVGDIASDGKGSIQATIPGGSNWSAQDSAIKRDLLGVDCPTASTCFAVGSDGAIVGTTDAGANWTRQDSGTGNLLSAVSCADASHCVAVGGFGIVLTTSDGGGYWSPGSSGTSAYLAGVSCPTTSTCLAVGEGGTVIGSTDGGKTWSPHDSKVGDDLMSISCSDSSHCLATGSLGTVVSTADGGNSWLVQGTGTSRALRAAICPTTVTCFAAGDAATILGVAPRAVAGGGAGAGGDGGNGLPGLRTSPTCARPLAPTSTILRRKVRISRRGISFAGSSLAHRCLDAFGTPVTNRIKRVEVAVARVVGRRCRFLTRSSRFASPRSCARPVFRRVKVRGIRVRGSWEFSARASLPPGVYRLVARSTDLQGNVERRAALRVVKVRLR